MLRWCAVQEAVLEETANMRWGPFKSILADAVVAHLQPIQQQYAAVMADETYLDEVCTKVALQHLQETLRSACLFWRTCRPL